ncbi:MAG: putative toxin-antitoxin system toxin component, PIN family [Chitinophagales bacterium]
MQRIVIDTNVIVSALIGSANSQKIIYDFVFGKKVIVCSSPQEFSEYVEVLNRDRFAKYPEFVTKAEIVLNKIQELSLKFFPDIGIHIINDEKDNRFLELAAAAGAGFVITGNSKDFTMAMYDKTKIVSPAEYVNQHFSE